MGRFTVAIVLSTVLVATLIGVTVPKARLSTQAVSSSGVIAMAHGSAPVLIARPALLIVKRFPSRLCRLGALGARAPSKSFLMVSGARQERLPGSNACRQQLPSLLARHHRRSA